MRINNKNLDVADITLISFFLIIIFTLGIGFIKNPDIFKFSLNNIPNERLIDSSGIGIGANGKVGIGVGGLVIPFDGSMVTPGF